PESWRAADNIGFLDAVAPLLARARQRVREEVRALAGGAAELPFDPDTAEEVLVANLPAHLRRMLTRTLVLELNVARLRGLLPGETPEERFRGFLELLRQRDTTLAILQEYPVLARQLVLGLERWAHFSLEFLEHLCADWKEIRAFDPAG